MTSGRFRSALKRVPATNPSCTDSVKQFAAPGLRVHSFVKAGTTADPLNHKDMPSSSAMAKSASVRQRDLNNPADEASDESCKREIVA